MKERGTAKGLAIAMPTLTADESISKSHTFPVGWNASLCRHSGPSEKKKLKRTNQFNSLETIAAGSSHTPNDHRGWIYGHGFQHPPVIFEISMLLYSYKMSRVYCSKRQDNNGSFQSQHFLHGCTRKFTFSLENPSTETLFLLGNPSGLFGILYFRI